MRATRWSGCRSRCGPTGLITLWLRHAEPGRLPVNPVLAGMLSWAAQLLVWAVLLLFFLGNVGVNVTAFVASLGIGGVAVALALQNVLGDLFASAAIGLDKPFEVGQFIAFGDELGTVTHVGVKTTRIRSLSGEELVISNTNLLKELIHNHTRRTERRIVFGFRVPYGTPRAQIEAIPGHVRGFIELEEKTRFDRGHFASFGEHGPEFEFVYFVLEPDYTLYRDIQQRVNLRIMALLEELGVEFAVPARRLKLSAEAAEAAAALAPLFQRGQRRQPFLPGLSRFGLRVGLHAARRSCAAPPCRPSARPGSWRPRAAPRAPSGCRARSSPACGTRRSHPCSCAAPYCALPSQNSADSL